MKKIDSLQVEGVCARARFPLAAVALAAVILTQSVEAQEAKMATTVVTAARAETSLEDTLANVTVITREQISNLGAGRSLAEVLQRMAGVQMASYGGRGHGQSVFLRGAAAGKALMLIDGVRYGSGTMGEPVLDNIPLELIERIEVLKGSASALYGSEAMSGVIHIITKRPNGGDQSLQSSVSVSSGSYGHSSGVASLQGAKNGWDYQIGLNRLTEQGQSAANAKESAYSSDRDAFDQTAVNVGMGYAINQNWRLDTLVTHSDGTVFTDSEKDAFTYTDLRTQMGSVKVTGRIFPRWKSAFTLGETEDKQINLGRSTASKNSRFNTSQTQYKWDNELNTAMGLAQFGVEHLAQKVDTTNTYAIQQRKIDSAFIGLTGGAGRHSWQVNLRTDDNSQFGQFTTYGLSYGMDVVQGVKLVAGHGTSIRAPSFNDMYYEWSGNPLLQPEKGQNNELSLQWTGKASHVNLTRYLNKIDNLISYSGGRMMNTPGVTRMKGWTLDYGVHVFGWDVAASLDLVDAKTANGMTPARRAKQQATLRVDKSVGAWKLGASALRVGSRGDNRYDPAPFNTAHAVTLPAYTTVDIHAQYQLQRDWALQGRIANLSDKSYETAHGFNQLGRAAYVTLKWTPH